MGMRRAGGIASAAALAVAAWPLASHAGNAFEPTTQVARWFEHGAKLWSVLASHLRFRSPHTETDELDDVEREARFGDAQRVSVVMQDECDASPEMLTLRYRLAGRGGFETYAGAGVNQGRYLDTSVEPSMYWLGQSRRTYGMAAEFGAAWRMQERFEIRAALRWLDYDGDTRLMRTRTGMVETDPLAAGLRMSWRF